MIASCIVLVTNLARVDGRLKSSLLMYLMINVFWQLCGDPGGEARRGVAAVFMLGSTREQRVRLLRRSSSVTDITKAFGEWAIPILQVCRRLHI
jgi:hypothetical protein